MKMSGLTTFMNVIGIICIVCSLLVSVFTHKFGGGFIFGIILILIARKLKKGEM